MNRISKNRSGSGWVLAIVALAHPAWSQLPVARLTSVFPPGGQAGTVVEVSVAGTDLDDAGRIYFSHPGLTTTAGDTAGRFAVTIASNVPPGAYDARVAGRFGISNPRRFMVSALPQTIAPATNTARAAASLLPLDTTVNGRVSPNGTAWFRLALKKSQRVFLECMASTLDSRMEPTMELSDGRARELDRSRAGEVIDFTVPAAGEYFLRVADFLYRGGEEYFYRLTASTAPRADLLLPPVATAGGWTNVTLVGRGLPSGEPFPGFTLDGKPLQALTVRLEEAPERAGRLTTVRDLPLAGAALDGFDFTPAGQGNRDENALFVTFAPAPVVLEQESNDRATNAQKISPPCEVAGQFHPARDVDWFTFEAKKGDAYWIEVVSHRLGWPTDPWVGVERVTRNERGEEQVSEVLELQDNDASFGDREFNTATRDPSARFEAAADGAYRLQVRDLFNSHRSDPRLAYRLAVRRAAPDFRLVAAAVAPKLKDDAKDVPVGVPLLRRGETVAVRVMAFRRDGFDGAIELDLDSPPAGLAGAGRIDAGKSSGQIWLTAAPTAAGWVGALRIMGKAKIGETKVVREARAATLLHAIPSTDAARPRSRLASEFAAAITDKESAPVRVTATERTPVEAEAGTKVKVPLTVTRQGGFENKLTLKPVGAGLDVVKAIELDGKATNGVLELDLGSLKLAPGTHTFTVQGVTAGKYRNDPEAAELAQATAKEAAKNATEAEDDGKKAADALERAGKEAAAAEAASTAARQKLAEAKAAAEKSPSDATTATRDAEEKNAEAIAVAARAAAEAKAAAAGKKSATEARIKQAQAKKESTAARAKQLGEKAKARDVTIPVCSAPIQLLVKAPVPAAKK